MNNLKQLAMLTTLWLVLSAGTASAGISSTCEVYVPCEHVLDIHTGEGRHEAFGRTIWRYFGVSVRIDPSLRNLGQAYAACPDETLVIHIGDRIFDVDKRSVSPDGLWFAVRYRTAKEALDAAMSMCPEKVINHIPNQIRSE